jgi:hypothetical protein
MGWSFWNFLSPVVALNQWLMCVGVWVPAVLLGNNTALRCHLSYTYHLQPCGTEWKLFYVGFQWDPWLTSCPPVSDLIYIFWKSFLNKSLAHKKMSMQLSLLHSGLGSFSYIPRSGTVRSYGHSIFIFGGICILILIVSALLYLPANSV